MPLLWRLVVGLTPRTPLYRSHISLLVHVSFAVDKVALGEVFLRVVRFASASIVLSMLHARNYLQLLFPEGVEPGDIRNCSALSDIWEH